MTTPFGQFLTPPGAQQNPAHSASRNSFASKSQGTEQGAGDGKIKPGQNQFLDLIMSRLQAASPETGKDLAKALEKTQSENIHPGFLKNLQHKSGNSEGLLGLGNLSQETLAQLTAQFQNGEPAGLLGFINGKPGEEARLMSISDTLGLGGENQPGSLNALLQQINLTLEKGSLKSTHPELHSGLSDLKDMLNRSIASGDGLALNADIKDMAEELNALLTSTQANGNLQAGSQNGRFEALQNQLRSFLTIPPGQSQPAQSQDVQAQLRPDVMQLLNSNNFAGFQSRGKSFGAFSASGGMGVNINGIKPGDIAAQMNALEPGQGNGTKNNSFSQIMQQMTSAFSGFAKFGEGQGNTSGKEDMMLQFNTKNESSVQQNALMSNSNPLGMNAATSLVTQAPQAGSSHQATQMVAAQITKNAAQGQSRHMTLYLNPPELGRVHVKMELSRDNTLKARVISEKADTHTMLQRDFESLARSLEQAGIDLGGEGLEFELADQDSDFDEFLNHESGSQQAGGNAGSVENGGEEIIETTIRWHIDPATGHARYNILA